MSPPAEVIQLSPRMRVELYVGLDVDAYLLFWDEKFVGSRGSLSACKEILRDYEGVYGK